MVMLQEIRTWLNFVVLGWGLVLVVVTHILQDYFTGTEAILHLSWWLWSKYITGILDECLYSWVVLKHIPALHDIEYSKAITNIEHWLEFKLTINAPCLTLVGDPLQWRHNERDGLSNHQPCDCFLNCLLRRRSSKTSKLRVTGLSVGNSPVTGEFPAQRASNAENVSIWWRHRGMGCLLYFIARTQSSNTSQVLFTVILHTSMHSYFYHTRYV